MPFKFLVCILLFGAVQYSFAQTPDPEIIVEDLIEDIIEETDEELDFSEISERLNYYLKNPIDLNKAENQDLVELYFLSPFQIQELLTYRKESGRFISLYELQSITGFDEQSIQRLLPFITIREVGDKKPAIKDGEHDLMLRYGRILEKQKGYLVPEKTGQSHYMGTPDRLFVRYRYRLGNKLQVALNMKKDAGEEFFKGNQRNGFDFYSASVFIRNIGKVSNLVIGDYSLQLGQGLSLWNGLSFGKGSLVQNVARQGVGLRPYTSTNESQYLRGIASTISFGKLEILPFISYKQIDATLSSDSSFFSSIGSSGYHRTPSENKNRNSVSQLVYGLNLSYKSDKLKVGATAFQTSFDKPMIPNQQLYNKYSFQGDVLTNSSIDYHYTYRNVYIFGEGAYSLRRGFGFVNGIIGSLSHQLSFVILHRQYQKEFFSFLNQGFAENSKAVNEKGLYTGLIWNPNRRIEWVAYADYFKFPWLRYRVDGPSQGYDVFSQFSYSPKRTLNFLLRYRYRNKQENATREEPVNKLENVVRHQARIEAKYKINETIQFRNRFEFVNYAKGINTSEKGYMLYHDLIVKPPGKAISGNMRLAAFKTDSYDSKIYAFENDVLYGYSFPPYYNTGFRLYSNVRYRIKRNIDFWVRYASFLYPTDGIGSGLDYIEGNMKSDIRLQVRFQF